MSSANKKVTLYCEADYVEDSYYSWALIRFGLICKKVKRCEQFELEYSQPADHPNLDKGNKILEEKERYI